MKRILLIGLIGGVLIAVLRLTEYRFLVVENSLEIYGGLVALIFAGLGIWFGIKLSRPGSVIVKEIEVPVAQAFVRNAERLEELGLTPRELETLELLAQGLSNREIAERLVVSENTVKTHISRVLGKLGVSRRIQAVQMGREAGLLR